YKHKLVTATEADTVRTTLFGHGWPDAPHRTLRTPFVEAWLGQEAREISSPWISWRARVSGWCTRSSPRPSLSATWSRGRVSSSSDDLLLHWSVARRDRT